MNKSIASRVEKLEAELKVFSQSRVWLQIDHARVRVDINHKRGEELIFDTPRECAEWVDQQTAQFDNITGFAFIDDVRELLEGSQRDLFDAIYEGAPCKAVGFNLVGRGKDSHDTIAQLAIASWWHSLTGIAYQEWRQEVEARVDAFIQAWDNTAAMLS